MHRDSCPKCRFCNKHAQCPGCGRFSLVERGHACAHPECDKLLCPYCPPYCKEHRSEMEEEAVAEGAARNSSQRRVYGEGEATGPKDKGRCQIAPKDTLEALSGQVP